jgi:hypothetical protein
MAIVVVGRSRETVNREGMSATKQKKKKKKKKKIQRLIFLSESKSE